MKKLFIKMNVLFVLSAFIFPTQMFAVVDQENIFYYFDNVNGYKDFKKNYKTVDILAPQIYVVETDLKVQAPKSKSLKVVKEAKRKKVETIPLLVQKGFDKVLMSDILLSQSAQDEIIEYMVKEADKYDYSGWQFDFENINHLDRDMYTAFVKKTHEALKKENLKFSVAVVVRSNDYNPNSKNQDWSSAYDYKELAKYSDFLSLMTYDEPYSIGPVASLPYVERTIKYMLTQAPAEKLSLGVPMYCWHWVDGKRIGSTTHRLAEKNYRKGKDRSTGFDEILGAGYYKFAKGGEENVIWCDTGKGVEKKKDIVEKYGLRGFSLWALGQADSKFWSALK
jgi:spore germination protein YaaH